MIIENEITIKLTEKLSKLNKRFDNMNIKINEAFDAYAKTKILYEFLEKERKLMVSIKNIVKKIADEKFKIAIPSKDFSHADLEAEIKVYTDKVVEQFKIQNENIERYNNPNRLTEITTEDLMKSLGFQEPGEI